ncbi:MAG: hypothetical protein C0432_06200 [Candidatus Puniceispirillum sp.]|nr:hypothetical protein [Candidatus Puniceispirillum sp.]
MVHLKNTAIMKNTVTTVIFLSLFWNYSRAQTIHIGQDGEQIKQIIELTTRSHNRPDSYGNRASSRAVWDVRYQDGQVSEVIQCFYNQYLVDFQIIADFCKYYVMNNGKLSYVLTQYENVSLSDLRKHFNNSYKERKVEDYYFSEDFRHYSKLYLHQNGLATVEWRINNPLNLPSSVKENLERKTKALEQEQRRYEEAEKLRLIKENEIKSKIYDLQEYSPNQYKQTLLTQKGAILNFFKNTNNFPSYESFLKEKIKYKRFTNVYNVNYRLIDNRTESQNYGSAIVLGSGSIKSEMNATLVSGTDKDLRLLRSASIMIPRIYIEGVEVMTEATINNLKVDFTRGLTEVKINNGDVKFKKYSPEEDLQSVIANKIKEESNGRFLVKYEVSEIMGEREVKVETEKIARKGIKVLNTVGGIAVLGALLYFGSN